jgi:hypothetical protein
MKKLFRNILILSSLLILTASQGCKDENPVVISGVGSLYDPSVRPMAIYTYPSNNAVGPFTGLYSGEGMYSYPHFKIQFNKIIREEYLNDDNVKISGFDEPTRILLLNYSTLSGMYEFLVTGKNGYYGTFPTYQLGKTYTVTVSSAVQDIHNQPLVKDVQFSYSMENTFKVVKATPKDSFTTSSNELRLYFNSQIDTSILSKVTITPAVSGTWYIMSNGLSMVFYGNSLLPSNTTYTISLPATAADKFGNTLGVPFNHSFKTGSFKLMSTYPENGQTSVSLDYGISFSFNNSIKTTSVPGAFSISPAISGTFSYYGNGFSFEHTEPFKEKTVYTVTLSAALQTTAGLSLSSPTSISFTSEGFRVKQFLPNNYYNTSRYSNIEVVFNTKIDTAGAIAGIVISPATAGKFYFSTTYRSVVFKPDSALLPKTTYSILVSNDIKSAAGNPLEYNSSHTFTTGE